MYVVRSKIGNSPRHFRSSSIERPSTPGSSGAGLSPHKVAQRYEGQPGRASLKRYTKAGDPPRRDENPEKGRKAKQRAPRTGGREVQYRFSRASIGAPERQMCYQNHDPNERPAEECHADHEDEG